jgi:peptidoglycan/xylan/chitin deacetylase (PgdA/CDA1 family)
MNRIWRLASLVTANRVQTSAPAGGGAVYITFDDGPDPVHTAPLLELLARHDAKASFFMIGEQIEARPELAARIHAAGHTIGNHSLSHPKMRQLDRRSQLAQIEQTDLLLERIDGKRRHAFRPPNGRVTLPVLLACLARGHPLVLWSIDSLDYRLDHDSVVAHLRRHPPVSGDIVLFHDDGECAQRALEVLLPEWRRAGLKFMPLGTEG